jgi:hypothetical protein
MEPLSAGYQVNRVNIRFGRTSALLPKISAKQRRELEREFIREETERFLANGGEIEVLPSPGEGFTWRPAFLDLPPY